MRPITSLNYPKPLKIKRFGQFAPLHVIASSLIALLAAVGILWWQATAIQDILQDRKMQASAVEVDATFSSQSKCKSKYVILTNCIAHLQWQGQEYTKEFHFLDFHSGDYSAVALASPEFPGQVTLDLAIEKIPSRFAASGIFILFGVFCIILGYMGLCRRLPLVTKTLSALNQTDNQPWQLVALPVNDKGNKFHWQGKDIAFGFGKKSPWLLEGEGQHTQVLGVAPKNGGNPAPLDTGLTVIGDLDKNERHRLHQTIQELINQTQRQGS